MHKFRRLNGIVIICLLILATLTVLHSIEKVKSSGNTIWVDDDVIYPEESDGSLSKPYKDIQSAINAASDGDAISVLKGTYSRFEVDKSVKITGEEMNETIITSGSLDSYLIDITADSVSIEGFTIRDTTTTSHRKAVIHLSQNTKDISIISNNIQHSYNGRGIYLDGTQNAIIKNNIINDTNTGIYAIDSDANSIYGNTMSNDTDGIIISSSDNNIIEENTVKNNTYGIYIKDSLNADVKDNTIIGNYNTGVILSGGSGITVQGNEISNNDNMGIQLGSQNSNIISNTIENNVIGIYLDTSNCIIRNNSIKKCAIYGVHCASTSSGNQFFNNSFTDKIGDYLARDEGSNEWDNGTIGNYWSDYLGPDNDGDGIGEISYTKGGVIDNYPTGLFQQPPIISDPSPENLAEGVSRQPELSVKVTDPEGERMDVYFYYILDNVSHLIDVADNVESGATASITFFSLDANKAYTYMGLGYEFICVWYVVAKDEYSSTTSDEWIFSTMKVPIDNKRPTADAGGTYSGNIGDTITFDGTGCNDSDGSIIFWRWSFGDGVSVTNVESPTHVYQSPGTWEVSLVIIDNDGAASTATTTVEISASTNKAPVAEANGPYAGTTGQFITFSSSGSSDPNGNDDIASYNWDFGDGTTGTGQFPTHKYTSAGTYTATLTVTDSSGETSTDSATVTISKEEETGGTPGFEFVFVLCAVGLILILRKKR